MPIPDKIDNWYDLKDKEKARVRQLREWAASKQPLLINSKLEELTCDNYCSTLCLVVRVGVCKNGATVLEVCDGTQPKGTLADVGPLTTTLSHDPSLYQSYQKLVSTILLPLDFTSQVSAGNVIHVINIHMVHSSRPSPAEVQGAVIELVVDGKSESSHHGVINVLCNNSEVATEFKRWLPEPQLPPSSSPSSPATGDSIVPSQLSTVIHCEDAQHATLEEILKAPVGSVHVVEVQVLGVNQAMCGVLEDICQLRCAGCKSRYMTPQLNLPDADQLLTDGDTCVVCYTDELREPNKLKYMYGFTMVVTDHCTQMEVAVSGEEGERFFSHMEVRPSNLFLNEQARESHCTLLQRMNGGTDPFYDAADTCHQGPSLNLCVSVFLSCTRKRGYKITNTILCNL